MKQVLSAATLALLPAAASADDLFVDDVIVRGNLLCVGYDCADGEAHITGSHGMKVKYINTAIQFDDTTTSTAFPTHDWQLMANETTQNGRDAFILSDLTAGTRPFWVLGDAPDNSLYVDHRGYLGLGTSMPQADLHITNKILGQAFIRLEESFGTPHSWDVIGSSSGFLVSDVTGGTMPVIVLSGAPDLSLYIAADGNVGLGTNSPDAPLEVSNDDTYSFFRVTAQQAAINQSADITFTGGPLGTGELRYNIVDGDGPEMRLDADGDMVLNGTLTTGGPTCDSGCDAVFDADYERLSVTDHAALMWEDRHLPAVGPTLPGQPMNVSEKMGGILNELEHAHIYIEELHDRLEEQEAQRHEQEAVNAALSAQVAALAARLDALEGR